MTARESAPTQLDARESSGPLVWQLIDSSGVGGAERHIATLVKALERFGVRAEAVQYGAFAHNPWLQQLEASGASYRMLDGSLSGLIAGLRRGRPDLLHTHGYKAGILGRLVALPLRIPLVSTYHTGERSRFPLGAYERLDEWTSFLGGRIAVCEEIRRRLPFSANVIPSWTPVPAQAPTSALPLRGAFVGRLSAEKRPELFCELACRSDPSIEWSVYGDGPLRSDLEQRFGRRVQFHGVSTQLENAWPTIGLLVMPSLFEGAPLAALEALAHGTPVLATRVGGLPSIVKQGVTGWLFERDHPAEALSVIETWRRLTDEERIALSLACWRDARSWRGEDDILPKIIDVYRRAGLRAVPQSGRTRSASPESPPQLVARR